MRACLIGCVLVAANGLAGAAAGEAKPEPPLLQIWRTPTPPAIDGVLDDDAWRQASQTSWFGNIRLRGIASQQTQASACYDDDRLYFAFRCERVQPGPPQATRAERDDVIWNEDSVEVFLSRRPDGTDYYHVIVNAIGTVYDERGGGGRPESLDADWKTGTSRAEGQWSAEIAVFWDQIGGAPRPGAAWRANFCRNERTEGMTSWAPQPWTFHAPENFGYLLFRTAPLVMCRPREAIATVIGENIAAVEVRSEQAIDIPLAITAHSAAGGEQTQTVPLSSGESMTVRPTFQVAGGEGWVSLSILRAERGEVIWRSGQLTTAFPDHLATLAALRKQHGTLVARGVKAVRAELGRLGRDLDAIERDATQPRIERQEWDRIGRELDQAAVTMVPLDFRTRSPYPESPYGVGVETTLRKVMRSRAFEGSMRREVSLSACRGEAEAFQIVLAGYREPLRDVTVEPGELRSAEGDVIPPVAIEWRLVGYVRTRPPAYQVDYVGWYPDPLIETDRFDVENTLQPVWVTVNVPDNTAPGRYRGSVRVAPGNAEAVEVAVDLNVWDFTLPRSPALKTALSFSEARAASFYGYEGGRLPDEVRRRYYAFLLERRVNPTEIYRRSPTPDRADVGFCLERGMNAFNLSYIGWLGDEAAREKLRDLLGEYRDFLSVRGWDEYGYVYGFDEVQPDRYPQVQEMYGMIGEFWPELPRGCTVIPNAELTGYVDIWIPITANYRAKPARERQAAGDEVWWYICCGPRHPYANWFIDYPAIDHRIVFWQTWQHDVTGFLYYAINRWVTNEVAESENPTVRPIDDPVWQAAIAAGKRWPEVEWNTFTWSDFNGDGHLIYPGPNGRPWSSVRFEIIRDGIEDYDYFHLLRQGVDRLKRRRNPAHSDLIAESARVLRITDDLSPSLTKFTQDPRRVEAARELLGDQIERVMRALNET